MKRKKSNKKLQKREKVYCFKRIQRLFMELYLKDITKFRGKLLNHLFLGLYRIYLFTYIFISQTLDQPHVAGAVFKNISSQF